MKYNFIICILYLFMYSCSSSDESQVLPNDEIIDNEDGPIDIQTGKLIKEIDVNGTKRDYIIYIPESYDGQTDLPLLFSFHGLTSNMEFNYGYTKFNELSENENFIVVYPNGIDKKWDISSNNNIDITFIETLLNQLESDYSLDTDRVYLAGMSMGGFFSFNLACQLSGRIAAVASVTGTMYRNVVNNCTPSKPMPIMQIHGTEDGIVNYSTVSNVLDFWTNHNQTEATPTISEVPNSNTEDGSTVEKHIYRNGDNDVEIHHYKVIGGGHDWPGYRGNMDINASEEVWNFVKKYDLKGKI